MAKGFKHGAGGSNVLNFKVVGNPQPSNPKENTIWVDTDTEITGWQFSSDDPNLLDFNNWANNVGITNGTKSVSGNAITITSDVNEDCFTAFYGDTATKIPCTPGKSYVMEWEHSGAYGYVFLFPNATLDNLVPTYSHTGKIEFTAQEGESFFTFRLGVQEPNSTATYSNIRITEKERAFAPGAVLIFTGTSSPGAFNALKKNGILLNPTSAKQYINGTWVDKTAKIYHNGEWVSWMVYLIKQGVDQTSVSGGWEAKAVPIYSGGDGHVGIAPTITVKDGYIEFKEPGYTASAYSGLAHTRNKIDLTGISKIKIYASGWYYNSSDYATAAVSVWKSIGSAGIDNRVANVAITDLKEYILDVSALSGEHYIGVTVANVMNGTSAYVNIYDLSYE